MITEFFIDTKNYCNGLSARMITELFTVTPNYCCNNGLSDKDDH